MKIESSKLTPEGRTALRNFGLAAARFFRAIAKKEFVPLPFGAGPIPRERILPRSIETDYSDARKALLKCKDPELRGVQDEMNKLQQDGLERVPDGIADEARDQRIAKRSESIHKLVELEKELAKFASRLK